MLSNIIRWNSKRKAINVNDDRSRQRTPSPPLSPIVFHVEDECASPYNASSSRSVDIDISRPNKSLFHQGFLRSRSCSPGLFLGSSQRTKDNAMGLARADMSPPPPSLRSQDVSPRNTTRKKSIPAPILIPDVELRISNVQIGLSPPTAVPAETSQPNANDAPIDPPSPSDNYSSISGTALAHAMIASTFVLTSSERRVSRHRSGIVRQDSATLPRRESCLVINSARSSLIPPVPPVPATVVGRPPSPIHLSSIGSGASTESEYPISDAYTSSHEPATSPETSGQTSRISEAPSHTSDTSSDAPPPVILNATQEDQTSNIPGCPRVYKDIIFDGPKTAIDIPLPVNVQETPRLSPEGSSGVGSDDHSLDDFDFEPPESLVVVGSPTTGSSASYSASLFKHRSDARRRRRFAGSNFFRNGFKDQSESIASHPGPSLPSASASEHDYGDLFNCELTVSPGSSSSSQFASNGSAGYQTFPETPMGFSPIWSPLYALLARGDSQVLRRRPPTPAGLGPRMLYSGMKPSRLQTEGGIFHRSRSPLLPRQETPSVRQPKLASVHATDTQDLSKDPCQVLPIAEVESDNVKITEAADRPHPLVPMSTSSSSLPEEVPRALSQRSSLSLPSVSTDHVSALPNSLPPVPPPIVDPASIPLPESTNESPVNSPVSEDNVMGITSSESLLQSPLPSSTTAVSQASFQKSPLSGSSLCHVEQFLPPPSSADAPHSRTHYPIPFASSPAASEDSISASFLPPPPYHTVVSERTAYRASSPSTSPTSSSDLDCQRSRHVNSLRMSSTVRSRGRARPPLPIGPRKPSTLGQAFGSYGSVSSMGSNDPRSISGSPWNKLQSAASMPPPKFQMPPPRWRGLTLEAAQWTLTSAQLQEVVSRALRQSSEGSSLRLLRVEVLEGEIADEMHRLELQHTDVKAQYRTLVRKRWSLMGALASLMEGGETNEAAHTMDSIVEVMSALDQLADRMHDIVLQMSQLRSLHDVHNTSALALALRKINGVFVRQVAEKERLQEHMETLKSERDEAWKHAEEIAKEYDTLNDRLSEDIMTCVHGDTKAEESAGGNNKRLSHISAVRKSTNRLSQAGLRSRSRIRPGRRASTAARPTSLALDDVVPALPRLPASSPEGPTMPAGAPLNTVYSYQTNADEAFVLAEAQREVYEMLGLSPPSLAPSPFSCRCQSMPDWRPPRRRPRPASESLLARTRLRPDRARATKSVMLEDIGNCVALTVK